MLESGNFQSGICQTFVKSFFSGTLIAFVEYLPVKKVGVLSNFLLFDYVNPQFSNCRKVLWISPVDKSVETVEKSRFSTAISWF